MNKTAYQYFAYAIDANSVKRIDVSGNFIFLLSNTGAAGTLKISINGQGFEYLPVGTILNTEEFTYLEFYNTDSGSVTMAVQIGNGDVKSSVLALTGTITTTAASATVTTPAALTVTTVAAAVSYTPNALAIEIHLYNNSANVIWYGDSSVDGSATRGTPINPGEKVVVATHAKLYFHAVGGSSVLSVNEFRGV